ncbi:MAG TPA: amidohydrolase family protein [Pyrinomonadaceae bacterium]
MKGQARIGSRVVGGWTEFQFKQRRMPTLDEINAVAPDTPVFILYLYDRAFLNDAALCVSSATLSPHRFGNNCGIA